MLIREARGHVDGVAHCLGRRPAVPDDAEAVETEQRRAAELGIVDSSPEAAERLAREEVADSRPERRRQLLVQQSSTVSTRPSLIFSVTFPVNPSQTITSVPPAYTSRPSTLPMKRTGADFSSWCASRVKVVAFALFLAHRQQPHARRFAPERQPRIRRPKQRELHQMLRPAFDRRAAIEQDRRPAAGRNDCRQRGPIHARQPPECRVRRDHRGAGVSGAEERVRTADLRTASAATRMDARGLRRSAAAAGSAISTHSGASSVSMSSAAAPGCRLSSASTTPRAPTSSRPICRCRAATRAPSMMLPGPWSPPMASMAMRIRTASQLSAPSLTAIPALARNPNARHPREGEGSILLRSKPKARRAGKSRPAAGSWELKRGWAISLVDGPNLAALVVAAVRTDMMRRLRFLTLRAGARRDRFERVVRAALRGPRLRMPAFWIGHLSSPSDGPAAPSGPPAGDLPIGACTRSSARFKLVAAHGTQPLARLAAQAASSAAPAGTARAAGR